MIKLGASDLRTRAPSEKEIQNIKRNPIYIVVDNVLDTYNVGAIFRLADAVAAEKVFLCGKTETPPHTRIKKASINTTEWVQWEYAETAVSAIKNLKLKIKNLTVVAIEQDKRNVSYDRADYRFPIALVVGNETAGVSKEVLDIADQIVELPLWGVNKSLNVMVSLGIVLYEVMKEKNSVEDLPGGISQSERGNDLL
ncbi:MAG: hypothetical protein A3J69_01630 [Candidatus Levybacteria bacterium RIFCSPHIGHO2_02_FULL_42_12]|nr:MAG: hypothetical protein A2698_02115 [Candidatus Levybacteria bacterium RIFCSPHIGHO2_01_FULL_42_15]OGH30762.1 MAG: hypothetical protein A3J69_01630 [Candidatus Levybacteria bacterium RIFCSPHIGHO2_02_FULL_42_12]